MDYVFCVRSIKSGTFGDEPGATHFLKVPSGQNPDPAHKIAKSTWFKEVQQIARHGPQDSGPVGDVLIYVHGFNTPQDVMMERHRNLRAGLEALGYEGAVISFDWPCASSALNYLEDRTDAKMTAIRLVDEGIAAFAAIQRPDCRINVHLMAHSMGSYVIREAFDDADDRPGVAAHSWSVSQVILCGADISAGSLEDGNAKSSSLYRHCVRLTNYFNPFDDVLSLSNVKRVGVAPRAGRVGAPANVPRKAVNVNVGNWYDARKGNYAGVKSAPHTFYFYDPEFLRDVLFTLKGDIDRNLIPGRAMGSQGNLVLLP